MRKGGEKTVSAIVDVEMHLAVIENYQGAFAWYNKDSLYRDRASANIMNKRY